MTKPENEQSTLAEDADGMVEHGIATLRAAHELGPEVSSEGEVSWAGHPFYQHQGPIWADDSITTFRAADADADDDGM